MEYVDANIRCKTVFSTHYHELTELAEEIPTIKNVHVSAKEEDGKVYFLHKVEDGPVDKSYGIHVAKLAGMPDDLIRRAEDVLRSYEKQNGNVKSEKPSDQISFDFTPGSISEVEKIVEKLDVDALRPKDALDLLYELKNRLKK